MRTCAGKIAGSTTHDFRRGQRSPILHNEMDALENAGLKRASMYRESILHLKFDLMHLQLMRQAAGYLRAYQRAACARFCLRLRQDSRMIEDSFSSLPISQNLKFKIEDS